MSTQLKVILCAVAGGGTLAVLAAMVRSRKLLRCLLLSVLSGVATLYAVNAVGLFTHMRLSVNGFTLGVSAAAGPPGVIALLLADILLK